MREIIFRGISKYGKNWVDGALVQSSSCFYILHGEPRVTIGSNILEEVIEIIPSTIGQHTGLKDKDNVNIFEGDIVIVEGSTRGTVVFIEPEALFAIMTETSTIGFYQTTVDFIKVIGNIHKNPVETKGRF